MKKFLLYFILLIPCAYLAALELSQPMGELSTVLEKSTNSAPIGVPSLSKPVLPAKDTVKKETDEEEEVVAESEEENGEDEEAAETEEEEAMPDEEDLQEFMKELENMSPEERQQFEEFAKQLEQMSPEEQQQMIQFTEELQKMSPTEQEAFFNELIESLPEEERAKIKQMQAQQKS